MGSWNLGKKEAVEWIFENIPKDAEILDVGVSDGKWRYLLQSYPNMDGVEIFQKNAEKIAWAYRNVFITDIYDFHYDHYNLVIFGDVIEHMTVEKAQKTLQYAEEHADYILVVVPFKYEQGALYGNEHEIHIQDDLTPKLFNKRYPGFEVLVRPHPDYCYYLKKRHGNDR